MKNRPEPLLSTIWNNVILPVFIGIPLLYALPIFLLWQAGMVDYYKIYSEGTRTTGRIVSFDEERGRDVGLGGWSTWYYCLVEYPEPGYEKSTWVEVTESFYLEHVYNRSIALAFHPDVPDKVILDDHGSTSILKEGFGGLLLLGLSTAVLIVLFYFRIRGRAKLSKNRTR